MVELYLRSVVRVTDSKHRNYSAPRIQTVVNTCFFSFGMLNTNYIDSVPNKVKSLQTLYRLNDKRECCS